MRETATLVLHFELSTRLYSPLFGLDMPGDAATVLDLQLDPDFDRRLHQNN